MPRLTPFCDGVIRRDFLRFGAAGLFGLSLPRLLAAKEQHPHSTKDVSLIYLFLHGGLSTIDTWDMKPDAPAEFRGEFKPIATKVPGIQIGELLPKSAQQIDRFSLVRSFRHHTRSGRKLPAGVPPSPSRLFTLMPERPSATAIRCGPAAIHPRRRLPGRAHTSILVSESRCIGLESGIMMWSGPVIEACARACSFVSD